jgi:hypothetical protein
MTRGRHHRRRNPTRAGREQCPACVSENAATIFRGYSEDGASSKCCSGTHNNGAEFRSTSGNRAAHNEASLCQERMFGCSRARRMMPLSTAASGRIIVAVGPGTDSPKCRCSGFSRPRWIPESPLISSRARYQLVARASIWHLPTLRPRSAGRSDKRSGTVGGAKSAGSRTGWGAQRNLGDSEHPTRAASGRGRVAFRPITSTCTRSIARTPIPISRKHSQH